MQTKTIIFSIIFSFLLGCAVTGTVGYFTIVGPGIQRTRQLGSELTAATEYNRTIKAGLDKAAAIARSSDSSITKLRNILTILREIEQGTQN